MPSSRNPNAAAQQLTSATAVNVRMDVLGIRSALPDKAPRNRSPTAVRTAAAGQRDIGHRCPAAAARSAVSQQLLSPSRDGPLGRGTPGPDGRSVFPQPRWLRLRRPRRWVLPARYWRPLVLPGNQGWIAALPRGPRTNIQLPAGTRRGGSTSHAAGSAVTA